MKFGGLLLAFGIAFLSLSVITINQQVSNVVVLTDKPFEISVPSTAEVYVKIMENVTNVTAYLLISHNGNNETVKAPYILSLTQGEWIIKVYKEVYPENKIKIVNVTENLECGNVTKQIIQNQTILATANNASYPVYLNIVVSKMLITPYTSAVETLGLCLTLIGVILFILERIR